MKKIIYLLALVTVVAGCSNDVELGYGYEVVCKDGVEYITFSGAYRHSITVKYKPDGSISTCEVDYG